MIEGLKNKKIGVLNGGFSAERAVSLRSGKNVWEALIRLGYNAVRLDPASDSIVDAKIEVAFNALHGTFGEDGTIQAYLEHHGIAYTGSGVSTSLLGMNKWTSKKVFKEHAIPSAPYQIVYAETHLPSLDLSFPVIIKPLGEGSSIGVEIYDSPEEFQRKAPFGISKYGCCIVEELIQGQEITIGILKDSDQAMALPILELRPKNRFYDYEAKYTEGMTDFIIPAELSDSVSQTCQKLAIKVHQIFQARGVSRVDMIVCPQRGPFVLEINTSPGLTDLSDLPAQARCKGISFDSLIETILESAIQPS